MAFPDGEVDSAGRARRERDGHDLAALAGDHERAVPTFKAELFDIRAERLRHPQPIQRQQRDQRVLAGAAQPRRDQHGADLVAIEAGRVRFVVEARAAHMHRR